MPLQFPWFEPYTLDYVEALTHVRIVGVGDFGFVQLMTHNSRRNLSDNKPQQLAVKSVYKSCTTAKQFLAEKVRLCVVPPGLLSSCTSPANSCRRMPWLRSNTVHS
jgi:hypothetical protein